MAPVPLDSSDSGALASNSPTGNSASAPVSKHIRCPGCHRRLLSTSKFCPNCGRSRQELDEYAEEKRAVLKVTKETKIAWNAVYTMVMWYAILLILNFVSAYVLPLRKTWGLLAADSVIITVCIIWSMGSTDLLARRFRPGFSIPVLILLPLTGVLTFAIATANNRAFVSLLGLADATEFFGTDSFFESKMPLAVLIVSICAVPGIFEEIFFRGLVQGTLEKIMSTREAWIVQAIVFAIAHVNPIGFFTYLVLMGLYKGWLRNRSGSLIPGMLVHFTHNLIVLMVERFHLLPW